MLDVESVLPFLKEHDLVPVEWILDGDLTVRSEARRNRNLVIEGPGGRGLFLKQPDPLIPQGGETHSREARFYGLCQREPASSLSRWLPPLALQDECRALFAIGLVPRALTLHEWYNSHKPAAGLPTEPAMSLGEALGNLHRLSPEQIVSGASVWAWLPIQRPWILTAHRPPLSLLAQLSPAGAEVLRILQGEPGLVALLDRLTDEWRNEAIIHGDIKSGNVLGLPRDAVTPEDGSAVRVIDWEFVQLGDPAWDLACAFADHVVFWTSSMPLDPSLAPDDLVSRARWPLSTIQTALCACWSRYVETVGFSPDAATFLGRAVRYSVARLILAAFEATYERDEIPVSAVLWLQLAANLAASRKEGALALYGLGPVEWNS